MYHFSSIRETPLHIVWHWRAVVPALQGSGFNSGKSEPEAQRVNTDYDSGNALGLLFGGSSLAWWKKITFALSSVLQVHPDSLVDLDQEDLQAVLDEMETQASQVPLDVLVYQVSVNIIMPICFRVK